MNNQLREILIGAAAGLVATVPMTLAMEAMHRSLPPREQYPLPPREITEEMAEKAGINEELKESERRALTWISHFGYGAATGALYAPLAYHFQFNPLIGGATYGLAVWAGSYLGWLPAADILRPATEHPPRRNALMITAHVVWGVAAGLLVELGRPASKGSFIARLLEE